MRDAAGAAVRGGFGQLQRPVRRAHRDAEVSMHACTPEPTGTTSSPPHFGRLAARREAIDAAPSLQL